MTIAKEEKWPILLVDDEEDIRDVLSLSIADMGYAVHTAENGEQAVNVFRQIDPPIVMTDIKMPGMDGTQFLRHWIPSELRHRECCQKNRPSH